MGLYHYNVVVLERAYGLTTGKTFVETIAFNKQGKQFILYETFSMFYC